MHGTRPGTALLEAIAAMTILAISAVTLVGLAVAATESAVNTRQVEQELAAASAFLDAVSMWPREDFDRRLGERSQGPWRMYVERMHPTLYEVELRDSAKATPLLSATFFRPEAADGS